jgi:hypothetical protein
LNRTFAFDETNHLRHRVLRGYGEQHMNMIWRKMTLYHLTFFLRCKISKYFSQVFPEFVKYRLLSILRYPYNMILAFPLRVA